MGEKSGSQFIATCANLARWAESGSREIDALLDDSAAASFAAPPHNGRAGLSQLWPLSGFLRQLRDEANRLQTTLEGASVVISPRVQTICSTYLVECDAAGAVLTKQLMRLTPETPAETINMATVQQYECFVKPVVMLLVVLLQTLQQNSVVKQEEELEDEDVKLLMIRVGSSCRAIGRSGKSGSILLESPSGRLSSSSKEASFDTLPPAYEASQASQESSHHARIGSVTSSATTSGNGASKDRSSAGFKGFFSKPFRAATDALRPRPEPLVTPLCQAASYGSVAQLKFLLAEGANINGRDEEGQTALVRAVAANQLGALEYLLKAGADHRVCDGGAAGQPPLFHAIDAENGGAVDLLLEYGASANQRHDWSGEPYLAGLVRRGGAVTSPEWLELLLSRGAADAGLLDGYMQPLVVVALQQKRSKDAAADDRDDEVVRLLLRHGASPDTRDASGYPLLHLCVAQGRDGLVRHLLELGADPGSSDVNGTPLLVKAAKRHDVALVQTLLEHGADANAHDIYLKHVLLVVFEDGKLGHADKVSMMALLLQHGAKPHKSNDVWNVTLLEKALGPFLAAVEGEGSAHGPTTTLLEIPELLLRHGADPDQRLVGRKSRDGNLPPTILTHAVERARSRELAELVLDCGADASLADDEMDPGRAPLALAARSGDRRLVELLLENGARVERGAMLGPGAVMETVVRSGNNPEVVRLLKA